MDAKTAEKKASSPAKGCNDAHRSRADFLQPFPCEGSRESQKDYCDSENPDNLLQSPIARSADNHTMNASQRGIEDAPSIDGADAQVNGYRCRRNPPPVETRRRNDAFLREELCHGAFCKAGNIARENLRSQLLFVGRSVESNVPFAAVEVFVCRIVFH
jgi:hypothetical protein